MSSFKTYFNVLSVKDPTFGAIGNGSTDDTAAIQAAFNAAFGSPGSPHGSANRFQNVSVYFPAGNYRITGPLYLVGIQGGRVFGLGMESTTISFENPGTGNTIIPTVAITGAASHGGLIQLTCSTTGMSTNQVKVVTGVAGTTEANGTWLITVIDGTHLDLQNSTFTHAYTSGGKIGAVGSEITPAIMTNGVAYTTFEGMTIGSNSTASTSGIYIYTDGTYLASANVFRNLIFTNFTVGILGGYGGSGGNCDNCDLFNVDFNGCTLAGLRVVHQNALNWAVYGGGASSCATDSTGPNGNGGAAYSCVGGGLSPIMNASMSGNTWDIINQSSNPMTIIGGSSESLQCIGMSGTQCHVSGFAFRNANSLNSIFVDISNSGFAKLDSCLFNPGTNDGAGAIVALGNNGIAILDAFELGVGGASSKFTGSAGSALYLRGNFYNGATPTSAYTGTIGQNI